MLTKKIYGNLINFWNRYSRLELVQLFCLLVFTCTLIMDTKLNSAMLIVTSFAMVFSFRPKLVYNFKKPLVFFTLVFFVSVFAVGWSSNKHEGWKVIERQLGLLLIPVLFFVSLHNKQYFIKITLVAFYLSIFAVCVYLLKCSYENFMDHKVSFKEWTVRENVYHAFARPVGMHATYLSLYVAMAVFIALHWFLTDIRWWLKCFIFLSVLVLVVTLTFLSSRVVIFSLIFILFLIYPFFISRIRNIPVLIGAGAIIVLVFVMLIRESSFISSRFTDKMDDEIKLSTFLKADTTYKPIYGGENRADRWYCAVELIKEKPMMGFGTGAEKDMLMQKYLKYNLQNAAINKYDAHNQYLALGIKSGILGLLVFLAAIIYALYVALRRKSFIYLSFTLLFAVSCITENVLESNKGIFFYAFFNIILCLLCLAHNKDTKLDTE